MTIKKSGKGIRRIVVALGLAVMISVSGAEWGTQAQLPAASPAAHVLKPPLFVRVARAQDSQREGVNFLTQEAGMAAYTNANRTLDLAELRDEFRTIELETANYIIGSVPVPEYDETWDVHVYAHTDGWVVAYYLEDEPATKIIDWRSYDGTGEIETLLERVLVLLLSKVGTSPQNIGYYDFRYPTATVLTIVADFEERENASDTFQFEIPDSFVVNERGWLLAGWGSSGWSCSIDDEVIAAPGNIGDEGTAYFGTLSIEQTLPGRMHTATLKRGSWGGDSMCAISFTYQPGE